MAEKADTLADIAEAMRTEGYELTPTGFFTVPDHPRDADPQSVERRRVELYTNLTREVVERGTVQVGAIAQMRAELGGGATGIPSIIQECQRFGIDLVSPFRDIAGSIPPSTLRSAVEQFIGDAELAQRLVDDPDSGIDCYRPIT
ncbi:hypothetical protein AB0I35_25320 [Nocardia sp. NPDC050378]|uniref:hypothetical protein n=1 Tax=Nocardia sp. NPDC050378 TaxID=3155400 RepID=UPI00340AB491